MPRSRRFILPGQPYHVIQRGHNKSRTFYALRDYELYLGLLEEYAVETGTSVHAYVLMTNHVHLLVTPPDRDGLSELMSRVNQRFVQAVNRRHSRCGSSWQGRFKSSLVDTASYFITCQRYIELNPVRARMVASPADYRWSSFGQNALGLPGSFVTPHARYTSLAGDEAGRQHAYLRLFDQPITDEQLMRIRMAAAGNRPLGDDAFLERLAREYGVAVKRRQRGPAPKHREEPAAGLPI